MRRLLVIAGFLLASASADAHDWNGIAIDAQDRVYVVDAEDGQVWRIDPKGKVTVVRKGVDDRKACPHTHHVVIDADGTLWLPSG